MNQDQATIAAPSLNGQGAESKKDKLKYEAVGYVYRTFNYDMFKLLHGNRIIRPRHLAKLRQSFEEEQLMVPIIVNERYEIIDGQHSFTAAKSIQGPIYFIIVDGYGLPQVHRLNNNNANWSVDEYMQSYCDDAMEDYIKYRDFKIQYGFGHQETLALLTGSTANFSKVFNDGNLKIKSITEAANMAEKLLDFDGLYKGFRRKSFVYAYIELLKHVKDFDHKEMLKKIQLQPTRLVDCPKKEVYLALLEDIYNYRRSRDTQLRFR